MANDGQGGIDSKSNNLGAAAQLGRKILAKVVGWGPEDGSKVKDRYLGNAVLNGPLACAVDQSELELGDAEADRPWEEDAEATGNTYPLRALFDGRELLCEHSLADASADQEDRWTKLTTRTKLKQGEKLGRRDVQLPSNAKAIGVLYDEVKLSASGYKGRIPLWHKVEVMNDHMGLSQEISEEQEKN